MAPEVDQAVFSWSNFLLKLFRRQTPKQFVRSFHVGFPPADCGVDERLLSSHSFTCLPQHGRPSDSPLLDRPKRRGYSHIGLPCFLADSARRRTNLSLSSDARVGLG